MATQLDNQTPPPDPPEGTGTGAIGAGTLATLGLGLIALAVLIWFLYPRFGGTSPTAGELGPEATVVMPELITATPRPATAARIPTAAVSGGATPIPAVPAATTVRAAATLPARIQSGIYAKVAGTGPDGLSFRSGPGLDYVRWDILPEGEILKITGGPRRDADERIWWRAVTRRGLIGWAAEQWLVPVEPPPWTPQPEWTPDLTQVTLTPERG